MFPERLQLACRVTCPVASVDRFKVIPGGKGLGLPVERHVVGVLVDDHRCHQPLGGQSTLDQPRRRRG